MKLTLEHLAGYLPYGLAIEILDYKRDYVGIHYSKVNGHYFIGDELYLTYEGGSTGKSMQSCKPILRPLSDLTKEIEVGGEKIVPQDELGLYCLDGLSPFGIKYLRVGVCDLLLKWHFDIHGLLEQNLAIDINTL